MRKNRLFALLLVIIMLATIAAGCNDTKPAETTPAPTPGTTTPAPIITTEPPGLGGYEFILAPEEVDIWQGAGDTAAHDAVKRMLEEVEVELDCQITVIGTPRTTENLTASAVSGTKLADYINVRQSSWIPLAMMGGLRPLDSDEMLAAGLELYNEDCFNQQYTMMTKLRDKVWGLDMTSGKYIEEMSFGHLYAFNKRLLSEHGYEADALYQAVRDGTWNYDMFLSIAREVTDDTDGDQVNDIWGVALDCDGNEIWSNGTGPIVRNEEGLYIANLSDHRVITAMDFMSQVSGDPQVQASLEGEAVPGRGARRTTFYEGKAAFAGLYGGNFGDSGTFRMSDGYGILPIPKGPDAENYMLNMVDVDVYVCLISNQEWENGAKVMTEIGRRMYDPEDYREYIFDMMQGDGQAVEIMFDYLLANAMMNIAKCTEGMYDLTRYDMYDKVYKGNISPAAVAESYQGKLQAELDVVFRQ